MFFYGITFGPFIFKKVNRGRLVSLTTRAVSLIYRAHLRALPDGGLHLRGICSGGFSGGRVLLHLPATQAAHTAAHPLLTAQSGRNHPHDPHHSPSQPAHAITPVQHGHHQLQLGGRRQLHPALLPGPG